MGLNLEQIMRESNRMLVEGMMTEEAKRQNPVLGVMDEQRAISKVEGMR